MTAPALVTFTYWVCVDCYETHHGVREEWRDAPELEPLGLIPDTAEVTAGLVADEHAPDCPNIGPAGEWIGGDECECERVEFTWSRCDGCGSTLGGAREALTVWEPAPLTESPRTTSPA